MNNAAEWELVEGDKGIEAMHRPHLDELFELLLDLLDGSLVAADDDGHARDALFLGLADGEAVDVVTPPAKKPRHAREDARMILDQGREDITIHTSPHLPRPPGSGGPPAGR